MTSQRKSSSTMKKYYQLFLLIICFVSIVTLLIYRHEYYRLRYVLEVLNFFGKPGLSEVEFCGPGFNATMLSEILRNSSMEVKDTPPLFQQIDENFYSYSSFLRSYQKYEKLTQTNAHSIDTIVIGKAHSSPDFRCNIWLEDSATPKLGRFSYKIISDSVKDLTLYIFQCALGKNLGKPIGISFYKNDHNINPIHAPINRLIQVNTRERAKERSNIKFISMEPAICVIPNQVPLVTREEFIEFIIFHHMMGVKHFTIYDSMISEDVIQRFNLLPSDITHWEIKFFPLSYPFVFAKSYNIIRGAIELDCFYRHFRIEEEDYDKTSHAMVLSWDEFLVPRFHNNLREVLNDFDPRKRFRTIKVNPLLFCLNQQDDPNTEVGHPNIMRKTHYYTLPQQVKESVLISNLDLMTSYEDITAKNGTVTEIPQDMLSVHKYTECRDPKSYNINGYNETQIQMFPNKFEGAILKFDQALMSNVVYRLYRSGKIWEKTTNDNVRDML